MANRYLSGIKTVVIGAIVGVAGNMLINAGSYFGDKVIKTSSHILHGDEGEAPDDGSGHKITYHRYQTPQALLENILEGDPAAERITHAINQAYSFAKAEGIPCDCVPLLALFSLQCLDITIIIDDSTSMGTGAGSRWEECRKLARMIANFGLISENSLMHLKFLNQPESTRIASGDMVNVLFDRKPSGGTPLIKTLEEAVAEIRKMHEDRRYLLYVFTDGVPSDGAYYQPTLTWVRDVFSKDREISDNVAINFIVEGTNLSTEKEYKKVDDFAPQDGRMLHIDTNLSYKSEQSRCLGVTLTEGLYKMKVLMGAVNEDFGDLDGKNSETEGKGFQFLKDAWDTLKELNAELLVQQGAKEESVFTVSAKSV
ncbi:MAG: hypothetical protein V4489_06830 [Chlamydiota bacterium]